MKKQYVFLCYVPINLLLWQKVFFCDRNFCGWQEKILWQKLFICYRNVFIWPKLWQKFVYVMEICFLKKFFSPSSICVQKKLVSGTFTFSVKEIGFCHRKFCVTITSFSDINWSSQKYFFGGILYVISRKTFVWEMGVSVISGNKENHFVEPCPPPARASRPGTPWPGNELDPLSLAVRQGSPVLLLDCYI